MDRPVLNATESEMIAELSNPDHERAFGWVNFDPDFTRGETARLRRNGWIEERGRGREREYKLTSKGIARFGSITAPIPHPNT